MSNEAQIDELHYMLSKQLTAIYALDTNYGPVYVDAEMRAAIENALTPIIEKRISELEKEQ